MTGGLKKIKRRRDNKVHISHKPTLYIPTMTYQDLPSRQKSQRLINRLKSQHHHQQQFQQYKQRAKIITNVNELLPGLNDISDAFEALPLDLIKYFSLLKEIDAKCINTVPQINYLIKKYIGDLHQEGETNENGSDNVDEIPTNGNADILSGETENGEAKNGESNNGETKYSDLVESKNGETKSKDKTETEHLEQKRLSLIKDKINEIIPCLEEKMHVTSVATDLLNKHMFRINNDYKLIINNNEIPESIRIGPLNHPAMIIDSSNPSSLSTDRSAQSQRSESRREALAAKKANKDDDEDSMTPASGILGARKKKNKDMTPLDVMSTQSNSAIMANASGVVPKKRSRKENEEIQRPSTPNSAPGTIPPRKKTKPRKEDEVRYPSKEEGKQFRSDNPSGASGSSGSKLSGSSEPTYCYCNQVSFGEMVGCDGDECKREWFHLPCIGFKNPPKGRWYCDDCLMKMKKSRKI
jgi:hypothetical protein